MKYYIIVYLCERGLQTYVTESVTAFNINKSHDAISLAEGGKPVKIISWSETTLQGYNDYIKLYHITPLPVSPVKLVEPVPNEGATVINFKTREKINN